MFQANEKLLEERRVHGIAFRVVLDAESPGVIAEPGLLDDAVAGVPRFDFECVRDAIQRLVVRAVHLLEAMTSAGVVPKRLHVRVFHFRRVMTGNVQLERTAEGDIQELQALADAEKGQAAFRRATHRGDLPAIARRFRLANQARVTEHFEMKLGADVRTAGQQQAAPTRIGRVGLFDPGIVHEHPGARVKPASENRFVLITDPRHQVQHARKVTGGARGATASPGNRTLAI